MKHANIIHLTGNEMPEKCAKVKLPDGRAVYLTESEYTEEELQVFNAEAPKWIVKCQGSGQFTADRDSGEDAWGSYCNYFDLDPAKAAFEDGRFVGFYLYYDSISYSGNGRYDFSIRDWGYPGGDLFGYQASWYKEFLFLFDEPETHKWNDWSLLKRDPEAEYESYLEF